MKINKKELEKFDNQMIKYISALKVLETQLEIINDDFIHIKKYNPIEHIKTRIKTIDSINKKLENDGIPFTAENVDKYLSDVVGARIICSSLHDTYDLVNIIKKQSNLNILYEKDFITYPKDSGYRSYHIIVEVPVDLVSEKVMVKAEIQIRTMAMDLWASLDHKLSYKSPYSNEEITNKLICICNELQGIDEEMADLFTIEKGIKNLKEKQFTND